MSDIYYPHLSDIVSIDQLPEGLSFIADDLNTIFSQIRYQYFIAEQSINESSGYFELDIVVFSALKLDIPGTGLVLTLNPDIESGISGQSIIPI